MMMMTTTCFPFSCSSNVKQIEFNFCVNTRYYECILTRMLSGVGCWLMLVQVVEELRCRWWKVQVEEWQVKASGKLTDQDIHMLTVFGRVIAKGAHLTSIDKLPAQ